MARSRGRFHVRVEMSQVLKMTSLETFELVVSFDRERVEANGTEQMGTGRVSLIEMVYEHRMGRCLVVANATAVGHFANNVIPVQVKIESTHRRKLFVTNEANGVYNFGMVFLPSSFLKLQK